LHVFELQRRSDTEEDELGLQSEGQSICERLVPSFRHLARVESARKYGDIIQTAVQLTKIAVGSTWHEVAGVTRKIAILPEDDASALVEESLAWCDYIPRVRCAVDEDTSLAGGPVPRLDVVMPAAGIGDRANRSWAP
jgi:hypothetical protein